MMMRMIWTGMVLVVVALGGGAVQAAVQLDGPLYLLFAFVLMVVVALSNRELFGLADSRGPGR
jgi:hypothetical protein